MVWTIADEIRFREAAMRAGMESRLEPRPDVDRVARELVRARRYEGPERRSEFSRAARDRVQAQARRATQTALSED